MKKTTKTNGGSWILTAMIMGCSATLMGVLPGRAQIAVEAWVQRYSREVGSIDQAQRVATDGNGNVVVGGYSDDGRTGRDMLVIKYSSAGVGLWTNRYNGPGNGHDQVNALSVDRNGNVFVTGNSSSVGSAFDYATIAYSGAGVPLWTNRFNGPGNRDDYSQAVAVDGSGNVFVTGQSFNGTNDDYTTIKYSSDGMALWTNRYDGLGNGYDSASAVAVDDSGNLIVTGSSLGSSGTYDAATIKYSGAGVLVWINRYESLANTTLPVAIAVDGKGEVVVVGFSDYDYATIKYSSEGLALWTNLYNFRYSARLALGSSGNVFVAGLSEGVGSFDYATVAYSATGTALWTNRYNGPYNSNGAVVAIAVDCRGNVLVTSGGSIGIPLEYVTVAYSGDGGVLWTNLYGGNVLAADCGGKVFVTGGSFGSFATFAYSDAGVVLWTNRHAGLGNSSDRASAVAVDSRGNVFVTGYSAGSDNISDYATVAYSSTGVALWTNTYSGAGNHADNAAALAMDSNGNVFVTGNSGGDYATIGYSAVGMALWTNRYSGPGSDSAGGSALAVDRSGNVCVTGMEIPDNGDDSLVYTTIKYSGGGVALWTNRFIGPYAFASPALAVDGSGNVFVTGGAFNGTNDDYATIKYSSEGVALWTNRYNGPRNGIDYAAAMAVDGSGNVFVTGRSDGTSSDYATIAYSGGGVALWTNRYNGPANGGDGATAMALDSSGHVFVTGSSHNGTNFDFVTMKYSGLGMALWTNRYSGPGSDSARSIAVDGNGNVVVTGSSRGTGSYDYAVVRYSSTGVALWTNRYNGPANGDDNPSSLAIGRDGSVHVAGASDGNFTSGATYDFATVKYLPAPPRLSVQTKSSNLVMISWFAAFSEYLLERNDTLGMTNWVEETAISITDGAMKFILVDPSTGGGSTG